MAIKLIIFDLDGTLVDSLGDLADSMNVVLESLGLPTHPRAPYRRFVGNGIATLVRRALPPEAIDDETFNEALRRMREEYGRRLMDTTVPYPEIPQLIESLRAKDLQTAILSNKQDPATRTLVQALFPEGSFEQIRGALPDVPLKPDPTAVLEMVTELGVQPEVTVYVGDTPIDMETGVRAGMLTVGVTWGFREAGELRAAGAHRIIDRPLELLPLVDEDVVPGKPPDG